MKKILWCLTALPSLIACGQKNFPATTGILPGKNVVTNVDGRVHTRIGEGEQSFDIVGAKGLKNLSIRSLAGAESGAIHDDSLSIGIPLSLLGQQYAFGAVFTKVSNAVDENLGRLKLTDLPPMHVQLRLETIGEQRHLSFYGCVTDCREGSRIEKIVELPVQGLSGDGKTAYLDMAEIGKGLVLTDIMDPKGEAIGYKAKATRTVLADYSLATLVFDIEHDMEPIAPPAADQPQPPPLVITARWYLKLLADQDPFFTPRQQVPGVGFFLTDRNAQPKIVRHSLSAHPAGLERPIHYFVKNAPAHVRASFAEAFEEWNAVYEQQFGQKMISYDFLDAGDPRAEHLVAGDIRYNVLEWDLNNKAPYGGLGPAVANQATGQVMSSNVLIQGPSIETIYKTWFQAQEKAQLLIAQGHPDAADALLAATRRTLQPAPAAKVQPKVSLGQKLKFTVHSGEEQLHDPIASRADFYLLPDGETYESYMKGYWHDIVAHELGHNLGLRHNFKGNLFATAENPSLSVMEYLSRPFRYKSKVSGYDHMALGYGYGGVTPTRTDAFCTDEDVADEEHPHFSAECSRDDATADPFQYFDKLLNQAVDYVINRGRPTAPEWSVEDLKNEFSFSLKGMLLYASSAEEYAASWSNWQLVSGRPTDPATIKSYVGTRVAAVLCSPAVNGAVEQKQSAEAKAKTQKNIDDMRAVAHTIIEEQGVVEASRCDSIP